MGRSNNQLRRSAKARGKPFIPKQVKSKARNQHRKLKIMAIKKDPKLFKKLSYDKVKGKNGKVQKRKFRAGGYNHSGKFGKAFGVKATAKKAEEAKALLEVKTSLVPLPKVLGIVKEHHNARDELLMQDALRHVTQQDRSSVDSTLIALCRVPHSSSLSNKEDDSINGASINVVVALLEAYPDSIAVCEACCRCLANMSLLSLSSPSTNDGTASSSSIENIGVAEQLVRDGAIPHVLRTMGLLKGTNATRNVGLSRRGQCWSSMALLNLLCLSSSGIRAAANSGTEGNKMTSGVSSLETLSEFIMGVLDEDSFLHAPVVTQGLAIHPGAPPTPAQELAAGGRRGFPAEQVTAADAAVGALTVLIQAEAPENSKGVSTYAEMLPYKAILGITHALLLSSELLVREGRDDGVLASALPNRREGHPVRLSKCSSHQVAAVMALVPLLHKSWMAMKLICRHPPNVAIVLECLVECCADLRTSSSASSTRNVSVHTCVMHSGVRLRTLLEASLFLTAELEGLEEMAPLTTALLQVHKELCESVMEVLAVWTAPQHCRPIDSSVSAVTPTSVGVGAAEAVREVLASGQTSLIALSTVVRVHADEVGKRSLSLCCPSYDPSSHALLLKSLQTLYHLSECAFSKQNHCDVKEGHTGDEEESVARDAVRAVDEVVTSRNTIAALQVMMQHSAEVLQEVVEASAKSVSPRASDEGDTYSKEEKIIRELATLFVASSMDSGKASLAPAVRDCREAQTTLFLQEAAILSQVCALLYSLLRHERSAKVILEDGCSSNARSDQTLLLSVQKVVQSLQRTYKPALKWAKEKYVQQHASSGKESEWCQTKMEETLECAATLSEKLYQSLDSLRHLHQPPSA